MPSGDPANVRDGHTGRARKARERAPMPSHVVLKGRHAAHIAYQTILMSREACLICARRDIARQVISVHA